MDITRETLESLLQKYSNAEIAKMYGVTRNTVVYWRQRYGLGPSLKTLNRTVRHSYDQRFFQTIDTPEKAYVLGWLLTDGCIPTNGNNIHFGVKEPDKYILEQIIRAMNGTQQIYVRTVNGYAGPTQYASITICGKQMMSDILALGVQRTKDENTRLPDIPAHLYSHLLRGMLDGDGWIDVQEFGIAGRKPLLENIQRIIYDATGCLLRLSPASSIFRLRGSRRDASVLTWMYQDATLFLVRKKDRYHQYWATEQDPSYKVSEPSS